MSRAGTTYHGDRVCVCVCEHATSSCLLMSRFSCQISMMGFCGTMAADFMDYLVADSVVVPPEMRPYYTEKIICMPHAYCVNDLKQSAAFIINDSKPATRSQYGLSEVCLAWL